ncbi:efflux RND transporter periplasmic adaptor subunit [Chitinophaga oryzae]|uniref:Efflux RND transporter periplasmic adaptor subunit n=1 Tax=Chitinophaga oryzae TaxID=2725414 RepID=A0AAE6ZHU9_9BACT|nr:efflux RND transporter periplasmic adaptor subunit [Chitinophaga oryzae]QJB32876.1 efflux RND transporter periplasmic adaptor subunit [Chitinophaga oryzae]QJB39339.1 efflux RND transporter periplasmic adaptor subunit [Chitinophaga oryzae]
MFRIPIHPILLSLAVSASFLAACSSGKSAPQQAAAAPSPAVPVDIVLAKEEALTQHESITGTTLPFREVTIRSEVPQRILQVGFQDGAHVVQGQLLYKLNDADLQARLKQLSAELQLAALNEKRLADLLRTEAVRQQEYDEVATKLNMLQAQKEILQAELAKTAIHAPFSGSIGITSMVAGAYVTPSVELVSLQDLAQIKISFAVPEKYLPLIQTGSTVHFTTGLSADQYTATIRATEPGVDADNRSILVQAVAANPGGKLKGGLSARVFFSTTGADAKGITIPTEALIPGGNGYAVFVKKGGTAKMAPVTISSRTETHAVITSGLADGDSVIVSNILRLGDGAPVQAVASK